MEALRRIQAQLREYWAKLSLLRRVGVVGGVLGVLLALGAVVYFSPGSRYVAMSPSPLPPDEVAAIRTKLTAESIPFRLAPGGVNIEVPEERYAEARVTLAAAGIPAHGGKGYELFDETSLMTTPFVQSVNYQRALQSELARSIMQLESVQSARVLIAKPEPSPFVRDQKQPTASVVLTLKPRAAMKPATAAGIVSLVARSVEGLRPENVTVIDSGGRLLSDPHAGERAHLPNLQLEYLEKLETYLATKAEEVLARHLGPGRAVIRVNANVNFQKIKERVKSYSPEGKVSFAERTANSSSTGGSSRGIPGTSSNITKAGGPVSGGSGSSGNAKEEVIQTDYLVSESIRDIEDGSGGVTRLTIAALVDLSPQSEGQPVMSAADAEEIIKQAIGFRSERDTVTLKNAKLPNLGAPEPDEALARLVRMQSYVSLARNLSLAIATVLVALVVALLFLRGRTAAPAPATTETAATPTTASEEQRRSAELARFVEMAQTEPERVAELFRILVGEPATT
jgi:flagellar M-ring protein FliF